MTKYCSDSSYGKTTLSGWWWQGFTDNKTVLDAADDVATANWGSNWRMPTKDEIIELYNNCTSVWTTQNGKKGRLFTGPNGNTLFLPAAGYYGDTSLNDAGSRGRYWSSTLDVNDPGLAYFLSFDSDFMRWSIYDGRNRGRSVRPVVKR